MSLDKRLISIVQEFNIPSTEVVMTFAQMYQGLSFNEEYKYRQGALIIDALNATRELYQDIRDYSFKVNNES